MCMCTHARTHARTYAHTHTHARTHTHTHANTHTHIRTHARTHTHMQTHTHTHTEDVVLEIVLQNERESCTFCIKGLLFPVVRIFLCFKYSCVARHKHHLRMYSTYIEITCSQSVWLDETSCKRIERNMIWLACIRWHDILTCSVTKSYYATIFANKFMTVV